MTASPHPCPPSASLKSFALGQLPDLDGEAIYGHLATCESCSSELETLDDGDDSLIADLRQPDPMGAFSEEPECRVAVAKALGSLAIAGDSVKDTLPRQIGEYEIVRPLGSGGMANVYLARHTKLGRQVALKVLATHRLADPRLKQRFESEMRAVGRLSHPNIVTAHDAREVDGTAVLITEYIDGLDLGQLVLLVGPLSIADACQIARIVCVALAYTHDCGFVHRDIKPSNIMLSRTGEVKLLDLGIARFQYADPDLIELTGTGQAMGTADYIAPEQVTDSRSVDARADIYSLGCTLMKLLTGRAPFTDGTHKTPFAKMTAHVGTPAPRLTDCAKDIPKELASLVDSMLEKDPDKRPQSPEKVAQRLMPFTKGADLKRLGQTELLVSAENKHQPTAPVLTRSERHRAPLWVVIAAGLVGIAIGLLMGIFITIRYPDGTQAKLEVPAGSEINIDYLNEEKEPSHKGTASQTELHGELELVQSVGDGAISSSDPLAFIVLLKKSDLLDEELTEATRMLESQIQSNPTESMVTTNAGIWIQLSEQVVAPIVHQYNGRRFAMAKGASNARLEWSRLRQHIISTQKSSDPIQRMSAFELEFDDELASQMQVLTRVHLQHPLAIVMNGTIQSAPIIHSEIGKSARLVGNFADEELRYISEVLFGALVNPIQQPISLQGNKDSDRVKVMNSLKYIGLAFHNFEATYQKLPGSQNVREGSDDGSAAYPFSWRVAMLPFIEHYELFKQYRFDEPWDSEHNLTLVAKMPDVYSSPFAPSNTPVGHTHFLGFATEQGALGTATGQRFHDITDGTSNTILIIESQKSVPWTKPEDLTDTNVQPIDEQALRYLLMDGRPTEMSPIDHDKLQKLITRDGHEPIVK